MKYFTVVNTIGKLYILAVGNKNDFIRFIWNTFIKKYAKSWVRPAVAKDLARYEKQTSMELS